MKAEFQRRRSAREDLADLFLAHPGEWIAWSDIAEIAGGCAWRTRISDCRLQFKKAGSGVIEWNRKLSSAYRFLPYRPLGPSAESKRPATAEAAARYGRPSSPTLFPLL